MDRLRHFYDLSTALLDDLDKESNTYAMRVKEWYGWHFPELVKVINDNVIYAKVVRAMGKLLFYLLPTHTHTHTHFYTLMIQCIASD